MFLFITFLLYALGLVLTAVGSRLTGRCATWCCALCGFPMWVVSGTVASLSVALPQLVLAFLASGLSITSLAVGAALRSRWTGASSAANAASCWRPAWCCSSLSGTVRSATPAPGC